MSPPISTYIYGLAAGAYIAYHNHKSEETFHVPLNLHCRRSKVNHINEKLRFETIEKAIKFYEEFFKCRFPFKKYD